MNPSHQFNPCSILFNMESTMSLRIYQVDAFTAKPFAGNPAGVCFPEKPMDDQWMRNVAAEMNLAETAFLLKTTDGWNLRWFTPTVEVDLCGHATLAAAHVLAETGFLKSGDKAVFDTRSGRLTAGFLDGGIELDFPAKPAEPAAPPDGLLEALTGILPKAGGPVTRTESFREDILYVGKNQFDYLLEFKKDDAIRKLDPDFNRLKKVEARGIIVTAPSADPEFDFISRFFAPAVGINEDPVTGSAHCCLGPYWMKKLGKSGFRAYQASSRGGIIDLEVHGNRVHLRGKAVTVFEGKLFV